MNLSHIFIFNFWFTSLHIGGLVVKGRSFYLFYGTMVTGSETAVINSPSAAFHHLKCSGSEREAITYRRYYGKETLLLQYGFVSQASSFIRVIMIVLLIFEIIVIGILPIIQIINAQI